MPKKDFFDGFGRWLTVLTEERLKNKDIALDAFYKTLVDNANAEVMAVRMKGILDEDVSKDYYAVIIRLVPIINYATHNGWGRVAEMAAALITPAANIMRAMETVGSGGSGRPELNNDIKETADATGN